MLCCPILPCIFYGIQIYHDALPLPSSQRRFIRLPTRAFGQRHREAMFWLTSWKTVGSETLLIICAPSLFPARHLQFRLFLYLSPSPFLSGAILACLSFPKSIPIFHFYPSECPQIKTPRIAVYGHFSYPHHPPSNCRCLLDPSPRQICTG